MDEDLISNIDVEPRSYQLRITKKVIYMFKGKYVNRAGQLERAARSVLIESPTGSGKTIVGLMLARWIQQNWGYRVGWVAMRRNLLAQAAEENHRRGFNGGDRNGGRSRGTAIVGDFVGHLVGSFAVVNMVSGIFHRRFVSVAEIPTVDDNFAIIVRR